MSLIDKLIDAVAGNCDTANLDRKAATEDILQLLRAEGGMTHTLRNEETGEGVFLTLATWDRPKGHSMSINGPAIPPEFQLIFGAFGTVTGVLLLPHEAGVIRVSYAEGMEIGFIPAIPVPLHADAPSNTVN